MRSKGSAALERIGATVSAVLFIQSQQGDLRVRRCPVCESTVRPNERGELRCRSCRWAENELRYDPPGS